LNIFNSFKSKIYQVNDSSFPDIALEIFRYQAENNPVYSDFIKHLRVDSAKITRIEDIPFLPVSFFKTYAIKTGIWDPQAIFSSSGTTGTAESRHYIPDLQFYLEHSRTCFEYYFGPVTDYHFLALLPSYLERTGSSLISMIAYFIKTSNSQDSGFFLREHDQLLRKIETLRKGNRKIILWGVTFALLDFAEHYSADLGDCLIFETGGMKGRRKEITRFEFHEILQERLRTTKIFSEYGMTELMSQAYTAGGTIFKNPPSLQVLGRDLSDPMQKGVINETAALNVIDLANFHSISFLETEDLGKIYQNGTFEVLGRIDNSDIRGCNLMI
jgi:hypothetical protein